MAWEELGSGGVMDAGAIGSYVGMIPNGEMARLSFDLTASPTGWMVSEIQSLCGPHIKVSTGSPIINFDWQVQRGMSGTITQLDPLSAVAIIIGALAVILFLIIGWSVWHSIPTAVKGGVSTLLIIGGVVLGAALLINQFRGGKSNGRTT